MNMRIAGFSSYALFVVALLLVAGCSSHLARGDKYARYNKWPEALHEYQQAHNNDPDDIETTSRLRQAEIKAADYYYHLGMFAYAKGDLAGAGEQFKLGLKVMPGNDKIAIALRDINNHQEAEVLYKQAVALLDSGKRADAKANLLKALQLNPEHKEAVARLAEINQAEQVREEQQLALSSSRPITLNFKETDIRDAYEFLTKSFGVNVIFDDGVKNSPVTLYANDVTFNQGLSLLLATSKTFYRRIGPNTILVAMDSKDKRGQYEDLIVKSYVLNTLRAKEMADIIKGVVSVKKLVVNETLNSISVRDTEDVVRLVERLINNNDRKEAEVILEVEILEINRSKADKLGLDFGSYSVSANVQPYPLTGSFQEAQKNSGTLTLPSLTLNFLKKDVDARILANPHIRVLNNKAAKIHIGDRVPLIATTIQDATGQVRNTFDYKDIGIRLTAEPTIHLDTSVTVKLGLEVSSLGANLGTAAQPAYSIGSRNAETTMLLRDGETAVLGGLIQDSERNTHLRLPGVGDIPAVGSLFTSHNDTADRTDVLLTITPRVVRTWELPLPADRQFYSGTENSYYDKQLFADLNKKAVASSGKSVAPTIETSGNIPADVGTNVANANNASVVNMSTARSTQIERAPAAGVLSFSQEQFEVESGNEFPVEVVASGGAGGVQNFTVLYNPKIIGFVAGSPSAAGGEVQITPNAEGGELTVAVSGQTPTTDASQALAMLQMKGLATGTSYLIYRLAGDQGAAPQLKASRVVVK